MVTITHLDQVLPAIEGRKDFIHVKKDGYSVVDYLYEDNDSFNDPIRVQCRGLKFNEGGHIIGRPFHKFFNYGQKLIAYNWNEPHTIMTKMDGSMVHSCIIGNEMRLCTRMGITDQSLMAEKYLTDNQRDWLWSLHYTGFNAIFEFISPDNRIVISYDEPELIILAVRHAVYGTYWESVTPAAPFKSVEKHSFTINDSNVADLREKTTGIEGYVVRWEDGTYVKIKGDEYTQMHRAVSFFERENMILPIVLDSQCDDLYPSLSQENSSRLFDYEANVLKEYIDWIDKVKSRVAVSILEGESRKDFAVSIMKEYPKAITGAMFKCLEGGNAGESVKQAILRNPDLLTTRW